VHSFPVFSVSFGIFVVFACVNAHVQFRQGELFGGTGIFTTIMGRHTYGRLPAGALSEVLQPFPSMPSNHRVSRYALDMRYWMFPDAGGPVAPSTFLPTYECLLNIYEYRNVASCSALIFEVRF